MLLIYFIFMEILFILSIIELFIAFTYQINIIYFIYLDIKIFFFFFIMQNFTFIFLFKINFFS